MKYQKIVNNKEINAYLKKGDANLGDNGIYRSNLHKIIQNRAPIFMQYVEAPK